MKPTFTAFCCAALLTSTAALAFDGWRLENATTIKGKGAGWDYVSLDATANRLFIGHRSEGLQVFDLATRKLVKVIGTTASDSSNGATLIPEFDLGISCNENGTVKPFIYEQVNADTYKQVEALGTQAGVRTMAMHPGTKKIYAVTAEGSADFANKITTSVSPFYANTFFPDSFVVLTYSRR